MQNFAVIVPIGPDAEELRRFHDFLDSLGSYEQEASLCVAIDSSREVRDVKPSENRIPEFITLHDPFHGQGEALMGRLSASLLLGFDMIRQRGPFDFVLRADTDALVVGEFRSTVSWFLAEHPQTGMLGTLGFTVCREHSHYGCEKTAVSDVVTALETMQRDSPGFARIDAQLNAAFKNGYVGKEYCQGGIYALPFRTLERMFKFGCFEHPEDWLRLAVPEDVMVGMLTRTVELESTDFSMPGEPFGSNWRGLAYSPEEMLRRGHALIHSVKSDPQYSETVLRRFFKDHRNKGRK